MDEARIGSVVRSLRIRRRLTQAELATQAGVARVSVSLLERGLGADLRLRSIHRICGALEIRLELDARWRGGDLERHLTARHSAMAEELSAWFLRRPEWIVRPEVSFSIWGERGVVDFIAWHPARRAMLLIEVKTEPVGPMAGLSLRASRRPPSDRNAIVKRVGRPRRPRVGLESGGG